MALHDVPSSTGRIRELATREEAAESWDPFHDADDRRVSETVEVDAVTPTSGRLVLPIDRKIWKPVEGPARDRARPPERLRRASALNLPEAVPARRDGLVPDETDGWRFVGAPAVASWAGAGTGGDR